MPTKLGEYCARCGTKCTKRIEGDKLIYECRNHGVQLIAANEPEEEQMEDTGVDDVGARAASVHSEVQ